VGIFRAFFDALNSLAGVSTRHNRALRDVKDWSATIQKFLSEYNLYGSPSLDTLLENIGKAKVDLTSIAYRAHPLIKATKHIKGKQVSPLITELVEAVESLRRALIHASKYDTNLGKDVLGLRTSFEKLQETLSDIVYI
jgi:hypothetical protein